MAKLPGLRSKSFAGVAAVQFLTAFNDNAYRWLIIPIGIAILGPSWNSTALSIGLAVFVLPYIWLLSPAGYFADRYPKRRVMAACMLLQAAILVLGIVVTLLGSVVGMFGVLALMGAQGALLSPARGGAIPESVREDAVPAANGVVGLAAVLAAVFGTVAGNELYVMSAPRGHAHWYVYAATLIGAALLGWGAALLVAPKPAADPKRPFPRNPFKDTRKDLVTLWKERGLFGVTCASSYFWFLASLTQVNIYVFAEELHVRAALVGPLLGVLAFGACIGAALAGWLSRGKVRLELAPFSAFGMAMSGILLYVIPPHLGPRAAYVVASALLFCMGLAAGFYDVPLQSYLQTKSKPQLRGRILATATSMMFLSMLIASGIFWILRHAFHLSGAGVFLAVGVGTLPVSGVLFWYFSPKGQKRLGATATAAS
jgi:acyl-[acyl-carrier-protein]-phospholipid O-acyltransferase/long-chain-fatty-acid--[acyl-carrier-protein] ligase